MAEGAGFEPAGPLLVHCFSRAALSTTQSPFQYYYVKFIEAGGALFRPRRTSLGLATTPASRQIYTYNLSLSINRQKEKGILPFILLEKIFLAAFLIHVLCCQIFFSKKIVDLFFSPFLLTLQYWH